MNVRAPAAETTFARTIARPGRAGRDEPIILGLLVIALLIRMAIPAQVMDLVVHYSRLGGSMFEKIHPGAYLLLSLAALVLFSQEHTPNKRDRTIGRASWIFAGAILGTAALGLVMGRTQGLSYLLDSLLVGPFVCLIMLRLGENNRARMLRFLIYALIVNDIVLFAEYATHKRVFLYPYQEPTFRPTALLGHPLMNGLINATAIAFVWITPWSTTRKLLISLFFLAAAFAAGARMASIFSVLAALVTFWVQLGKSASRGRIDEGALVTIAIVALGVLLIIITVVVMSGLADRLVSNGFFEDSSAQSRFTIYRIFGYLTFDQLMFGISREFAVYVTTDIINLPRSESPVVDYVVEFGVIGASIIVTGLVYFLWTLARTSGDAFVAIGVMIYAATASTNNTFSSKGAHLVIVAALVMGAMGAVAQQRATAANQVRSANRQKRLPAAAH